MAIGGPAPWSAKVMVKNTFLEFEYEKQALRGDAQRRSLSVPPEFAASQRGIVLLLQCQREPGSTDLNIKKTPILDETFVDAIGLTAASLADSQLCSKDSMSTSRQSTEAASTPAASEGTDNESNDIFADFKDGVSQSVEQAHRRSRPRPRPCKQKRLRLKRLTAKLVQNSIADPEFDIERARLPPSVNAELRGKIMRAVQTNLHQIHGLAR